MTLDNEKQTVLELLDGIARRDRSLLERLVTDDEFVEPGAQHASTRDHPLRTKKVFGALSK